MLGIKLGTPVAKAAAVSGRGLRAQEEAGRLARPRTPTCVPLQLLYNLFRLEVPDVDQVVLRTRHNPLKEREAFRTGGASPGGSR